jgi:ferredoxin
VNAFTSPDAVTARIERATGLKLAASRQLCSSLSFLNRRNSPRPLPLRLMLLGAGYEWSLFLYVWISRRLDRMFGLRSSMYGWAFYFGKVGEPVDTRVNRNVCIRCGSACPADRLKPVARLRIQTYRCVDCGATNPFFERSR